jgi:hypothetical protein
MENSTDAAEPNAHQRATRNSAGSEDFIETLKSQYDTTGRALNRALKED